VPLGKLVVQVQWTNLEAALPLGYGYGYEGGIGGGSIDFSIDYTPPFYVYPQPASGEMTVAGSYNATLTVTSTTETKVSTATAFNIGSDVYVSTIYVSGEVSALDGDLVVYQVNVRDHMVVDVAVAGTSDSLTPLSEINPVLVDKWLADGTWFLPYWIPAGTPPSNVTIDLDIYGAGTRPTVTGTGTATVASTRSEFNIYLMPGANHISFPMLPTTGTNFDLETLLSQPVANADATFVATLGHTPTLADIVESIWYYTGGTSPEWQAYLPGPAADDLTEAGLFQGLWIFTDATAFRSFSSVSSPIKMTLAGRGLEAGQQDLPPSHDVYNGWNSLGLVSERASTVSHMLAPLDLGTPYLMSWLNYTKLVPGIGSGTPYVATETGRYQGLYNSTAIQPGDGFWFFYGETSNSIVPVLE